MNNNGTYTDICEIGRGGGGIVCKAVHTRLNKEVVIKQIISSGKDRIESRKEVDLLKSLKHTYLPQVIDFFEEDGETYTVMDYISGCDMDKYIKNGNTLKNREIQRYAIQLCEAVEYLHSRRPPIIHSDIKPANIMLTDEKNICLIDFNVSLIFDENNPTVLGGTPGYAAPEQLGIPLEDIKAGINGPLPVGKGRTTADERSDIYSIGASIYYMITGVKPAADYRCKPLSEYNAAISEGMLHVVRKAMMLEPSKRYRSVSEMLNALKNIGKADKRYRALKVQRELVTVAAAALLVGGFALNRAGKVKLAEEHEQKYSGYLAEIDRYMNAADYNEAENYIQKAVLLEPTRITPYLKREEILHEQKEYEKCMSYPDIVFTPELLNDVYNTPQAKADMYVMAADSAFELEEYNSAISLYEKALFYAEELTDCYRDITISYARLGDIENAEISLDRAEKLKLSNDQLALMRGEISAQKGEYEAAFSSFKEALSAAESDYLRFRTLLVCDKMTRKCAEIITDAPMRTAQILEAQKTLVTEEYRNIVIEMLANEYYLCSVNSGDTVYLEKSAACYEELLKINALDRTLFGNYFNILTKLEDFDGCIEMLNAMEKKYPDDYIVHMNYSYTYIEIENRKDMLSKDFGMAYSEYLKAEEMYAAIIKNGVTDVGMDKLRGLIGELKSMGYIG